MLIATPCVNASVLLLATFFIRVIDLSWGGCSPVPKSNYRGVCAPHGKNSFKRVPTFILFCFFQDVLPKQTSLEYTLLTVNGINYTRVAVLVRDGTPTGRIKPNFEPLKNH